MRPNILNNLFADVIQLPGVGKRLQSCLKALCGERVVNLVFHFPTGFVDRRSMPELLSAPDGEIITALVDVEEYAPAPPRSKRPFKVICSNETGYLTLVFFNANEQFITSQLPVGQQRVVSGKAERFDGVLQMVHPDIIAAPEKLAEVRRIEATYPLTAGITQKTLGKIMVHALNRVPEIPEWLNPKFVRQQGWATWKDSLLQIHYPTSTDDIQYDTAARSRLAYDELLANQLALALSRKVVTKQSGRKTQGDGQLRQKIRVTLPFELTGDQDNALEEIWSDMASSRRMVRLLQGDVGSGKTVVALLALLNAVEGGGQGAMMAPTDVLARQHMTWIEQAIVFAGLEDTVKVVLLTGRDKGKNRDEILEGIASGTTHIVIGTHALFQEHVVFKDLALVVIDEQHRFGVKQRLNLTQKGKKTDILLMTATPIPRTLTLTLYGDMEISTLKEKPAGREPIDTRTIPIERMEDVVEGLKRAINDGNRVYWVCPLIEDSEISDLAAAEERYHALRGVFGSRVGLVHGKMKNDEKDAAMMAFKEGTLDVLVATTVIEVGVDVPEATIMVIEHAERFGLSQLHQLRGRVGRSMRKSSCILLYGKIGEIAKQRLHILRETNDGFRIAEEDLVLRGSGELLGTKQSGMPAFNIALLPEQRELLFAARDDTKMILETDPDLTSERGQNLRTLLYLFEYDAQIRYLMSG